MTLTFAARGQREQADSRPPRDRPTERKLFHGFTPNRGHA